MDSISSLLDTTEAIEEEMARVRIIGDEQEMAEADAEEDAAEEPASARDARIAGRRGKVTDYDFARLINRLSVKQNRAGLLDAIRSMVLEAELEGVEGELGAAPQPAGQERRKQRRVFMEWTPEGWREIV